MAVKSNFIKQSLILTMKSGQGANEQDILKRLTLSNINKDVSDDNLYSLANTLKDILIYPLESITISSISEIVNE